MLNFHTLSVDGTTLPLHPEVNFYNFNGYAKDRGGYDYEINALNLHIAYFSPRSIFFFSLFK